MLKTNYIYFVFEYALTPHDLGRNEIFMEKLTFGKLSLAIPILVNRLPKENFEIYEFDVGDGLKVLSQVFPHKGDFQLNFTAKEVMKKFKIDEDFNVQGWIIDTKMELLVLFACGVRSKSGGTYQSEREVIFLTNGSQQLKNLSDFELTRNKLKFPEFDGEGFSICEDMNAYFNDCVEERGALIYLCVIFGVIALFGCLYGQLLYFQNGD